MATKKITKKDNFTAIAAFLTEAGKTEWADVINHEIELLDKKAATAKATAAKKKTEGDALTAAVEAVLTDELTTIADIARKVEFEGDEVTIAKVQFRLNSLVTNGKAVKEQITIAGGEGSKARKLMAYKLADAD